jgi:hypothetical protein
VVALVACVVAKVSLPFSASQAGWPDRGPFSRFTGAIRQN